MPALARPFLVLAAWAALLAFHRPPSAATLVLTVGRPGAVTVLTGGATWPARSRITLAGSLVVPAGATLTIAEGVTIEAAAGTGIVVQRDARVNALGTLLEPIVLSCPTTGTPVPGCWEGVTILGNALLNHGSATSPSGGRGGAGGCRQTSVGGASYGGCTANDSSGTLRYVRVQYATHGLRLYGVGSGTVLDHIQVHRSLGNGIDIDGGAAQLRYLALTTNAQYGLAYRGGWVGQAQFVVIQQDPAGYAGGLLGENAASSPGDHNATPRSAPTLANLTIIAPTSAPTNPYLPAVPVAMRFAAGGAGTLYNVLLVEPAIGVDIDDASTCAQTSSANLALRGVVFTSPVATTDPDEDPAECTTFGEPSLIATAISLAGPQLRAPLDVVLPDLRARAGSALSASSGVGPPAIGVLETVIFLGAVPTTGAVNEVPWYSGWTRGEQLSPPSVTTITGTVVGTNSRGPLNGVTVRVEPIGRSGITDGSGTFAISGVPRGPVSLLVTGALPAGCSSPSVAPAIAGGEAIALSVSCTLDLTPPPPETVAAGEGHSCAVLTGLIYCAGRNSSGELGDGTTISRSIPVAVVAPSGASFTQVTVGGNHTCGLTDGGTAYCWGSNFSGKLGDGTQIDRRTPTAVSTPSGINFVRLTAGGAHTCGLTATGVAYCWGNNSAAQIGDGTNADRLTPVPVASPSGVSFIQVVAGEGGFSCGVASSGTAYCWGSSLDGRLGDGTLESRSVPTAVLAPPGVLFTQIDAGGPHACARSLTSSAYCWGSGSTGDGVTAQFGSRRAPTAVIAPAGTRFVRVTAAFNHSCGLTDVGTAYCWGSNFNGQLGDGSTLTRLTAVPVSAPSGVTFTELVTGGNHTCAVTSALNRQCWGANIDGQLGDGTTTNRVAPARVLLPAGVPIVSVSAGTFQSCGLTASGQAYCWGGNGAGQLGDGTTIARLTPVPASALPPGQQWSQVVTGDLHTCALNAVGDVYCWGRNNSGQLGDGTTTNRVAPGRVAIPAGVTVIGLSTFFEHTCASTASGTAYCWGNNGIGNLGDGTTLQRAEPVPVSAPAGVNFVQVAAGNFHSCGLTSAGSVYCWGQNSRGQLGDGTLINRLSPVAVSAPQGVAFERIALGTNTSCGVTTTGAAYCWGFNEFGQLGDGTLLNRSTPVPVATAPGVAFAGLTAGELFTCGVTTTGAGYCWGNNSTGQLGDGTTSSRSVPGLVTVPAGITLTQMESGAEHTCGATTSGVTYCWGGGAQGKLGDGTATLRLTAVRAEPRQ